LPAIEGVANVVPSFGSATVVDEVGRKRVEPDPGVLRGGAVALDAAAFEDRRDVFAEGVSE
jgi:hypothetical protein